VSGRDGFVTQLDVTAGISGLIYGSYYAGSSFDSIKHVFLQPMRQTMTFDRVVVVIGDTGSNDLPLPRGAGPLGGGDTFVAKLRFP